MTITAHVPKNHESAHELGYPSQGIVQKIKSKAFGPIVSQQKIILQIISFNTNVLENLVENLKNNGKQE
jgi:hypothetical protein